MLNAGAIIGDHRVEGILGAGGMGVVYEATQRSLQRRVALKALRPEFARDAGFVERFRREGRLQANFSHPHAVEVYEALEVPEGLFLSMRLVQGPTLAELLAARTLGVGDVLRALEQVAGALDAAHAAGIVHRDIKPANVLVDADGTAFLGDFGLSRLEAGSDVTAGLMGTGAYMAPEVTSGAATVAADRYAFGAMTFECLTGEVPFPGRSPAAVMYAHAGEPRPAASARRPDLPAAVDEVIATAMAPEPERRPSAGDLVARVRAALGEEAIARLGPPPAATTPLPDDAVEATMTSPVPAQPLSQPRPAPGPARARRPLVPALALIAGVALGAAGAALLTGDDPAPAGPQLAAVSTPPVPKESRPLGSALAAEGVRTVDCRGRPASPNSPECSIAQALLPGRSVAAPTDGAVFGWSVRGFRGEIALQVLRPRDGGVFQAGRTQYETAGNDGVHRFTANLAVERGDFLAVEVTRGALIGVRDRKGATTQRWFPIRRGKPPLAATDGPGTGLDVELALRADFVPGAERRVPEKVAGAAAKSLPRGKRRARRGLTFTDGRQVVLDVVEVGDRVMVDLFRRGVRVARHDLPRLRPGGELVSLYTLNYGEEQAAGEFGIRWVNENSGRIREHYLGVFPRDFSFFD